MVPLILSLSVLGHSRRHLCPHSELGHTLTPGIVQGCLVSTYSGSGAVYSLPSRDSHRGFRGPWTPPDFRCSWLSQTVYKDLGPQGHTADVIEEETEDQIARVEVLILRSSLILFAFI